MRSKLTKVQKALRKARKRIVEAEAREQKAKEDVAQFAWENMALASELNKAHAKLGKIVAMWDLQLFPPDTKDKNGKMTISGMGHRAKSEFLGLDINEASFHQAE